MAKNPIQKIFIVGFVLLALANLLVSIMTFSIKAQKYGISDLWQHPDSFAFGTLAIGLICLAAAYWFYQKRFNKL